MVTYGCEGDKEMKASVISHATIRDHFRLLKGLIIDTLQKPSMCALILAVQPRGLAGNALGI